MQAHLVCLRDRKALEGAGGAVNRREDTANQGGQGRQLQIPLAFVGEGIWYGFYVWLSEKLLEAFKRQRDMNSFLLLSFEAVISSRHFL